MLSQSVGRASLTIVRPSDPRPVYEAHRLHSTCAGAFPAPPASPIRELESSKIVFPHLQRLQRSSCPPEHHKLEIIDLWPMRRTPNSSNLPSLLEKHPIPEHLPLLYSQNGLAGLIDC